MRVAALLGLAARAEASVRRLVVTRSWASAAFAGLRAGDRRDRCRPEAALVVANVLFLVALDLGGVVVPIADLPAPVDSVVRCSPVGALADAFGAALGSGATIVQPLLILAGWAVGGGRPPGLFRWD